MIKTKAAQQITRLQRVSKQLQSLADFFDDIGMTRQWALLYKASERVDVVVDSLQALAMTPTEFKKACNTVDHGPDMPIERARYPQEGRRQSKKSDPLVWLESLYRLDSDETA